MVSPSVLSCLLFPFRAEEVTEPVVASLLEGVEGSSTPAGFMNVLLVGADGVRVVDDEWRSTPTLLLSYITRLAGSLSFLDDDDLGTETAMLDIDLILVFRR